MAGESDIKVLGYLLSRKGYFPALQMVASCDRGKAVKFFLPQHLEDSMLMSSSNYLLKASPPNTSLGELELQSINFLFGTGKPLGHICCQILNYVPLWFFISFWEFQYNVVWSCSPIPQPLLLLVVVAVGRRPACLAKWGWMLTCLAHVSRLVALVLHCLCSWRNCTCISWEEDYVVFV